MCASLSLTGCDQLLELHETVEGFTERFVVQGIYLGVEPLEGVDLSETAFAGARLTAFLADASHLDEIDKAPIENTALLLRSQGSGDSMAMMESGEGKYELTFEDGLEYTNGEQISLTSTYGDSSRSISVPTPGAASFDLDPIHAVGAGMVVDLSGQGFDTALAMVFDVETGEVTWSNEPADISDLYEMTHADGIGLGTAEPDQPLLLEIPAHAFDQESYYIVGIAGMVVSSPENFEGVNTALSTIMAGKLKFVDVCTEQYAMLCEQ
jgi:hypothetical protein